MNVENSVVRPEAAKAAIKAKRAKGKRGGKRVVNMPMLGAVNNLL